MKKSHLRSVFCFVALTTFIIGAPVLAANKPNIVIVWGDDIGWFNISAYNMGMMGYKTQTLTGSPRKAQCLPTGMASRAAPPAAQHLLPAKRRFARV